MNSIPIGPSIQISQNVIYALPSVPVDLFAGITVQTSILSSGPFTNVFNGLVNGCFVRCATGNTVVTLKKHLI